MADISGERLKRYVDLLPRDGDVTLIVLKGHLLIEEMVRELVSLKLSKPDALNEARFECFQSICLAEALYSGSGPEWVWAAAKKINSARNKMAHNLEPVGVEDKLADFVSYVEEHRNQSPGLSDVQPFDPLRRALGEVYVALLSLHAGLMKA